MENDSSCISDSRNKGPGEGADASPPAGVSNSSMNCSSDGSSLMAKYGGKEAQANLTSASDRSDDSAAHARSWRSSTAGIGGSKECRHFTAAQIRQATENFSDGKVLGRGAFGSVFMGKLMGCKVAVKRLESSGWQGPCEYRTEVEVLSRMRHPHIVLLMGHCPEEHCLVYEYLPGGSLQDFLNPARRRRPLAWADRVRVLSEIASALLYLHQHEPPIAHRDLKPDNVLLDSNLTSKIGDVGLARLVVCEGGDAASSVRGTAGYIDPEEVVTCEVSVLSDVYAFGLIALQLLMGEPKVKSILALLAECSGASGPRALSHAADIIVAHLDPTCGTWNKDIARQLAVLALRCGSHKRLHRPDIAEEIQPVLVRLADEAGAVLQRQQQGLEAQLICPLSKVMMTDPVVASDGFTYERSAIEAWLLMNNMSPSTGKPMQHKFLVPNNGLRQLLNG